MVIVPGDNREGEIEIAAQKNKITVVSASLPLVVMDGFVPNDKCQQLIDIARRRGNMKRSTMGVSQQQAGTRTSSNMRIMTRGSL